MSKLLWAPFAITNIFERHAGNMSSSVGTNTPWWCHVSGCGERNFYSLLTCNGHKAKEHERFWGISQWTMWRITLMRCVQSTMLPCPMQTAFLFASLRKFPHYAANLCKTEASCFKPLVLITTALSSSILHAIAHMSDLRWSMSFDHTTNTFKTLSNDPKVALLFAIFLRLLQAVMCSTRPLISYQDPQMPSSRWTKTQRFSTLSQTTWKMLADRLSAISYPTLPSLFVNLRLSDRLCRKCCCFDTYRFYENL